MIDTTGITIERKPASSTRKASTATTANTRGVLSCTSWMVSWFWAVSPATE
jgi:hypothetical protein